MAKRNPIIKIGISGSYGGYNLGDEAILESMIAQLRKALDLEITVFSRDPKDTLARHKVEKAVPVRKMTRAESAQVVGQLDLLILGGGGILFDSETKSFLREVALALEKHIPVIVYAISAGPLHDPTNQALVRDLLNQASLITVRDRNAKALLEELGVIQEIIVTADPALLLKPEPLPEEALRREHIDGTKTLVGMSVREPGPASPDISTEHYHALLANAADYMVDRFNAEVVFIPMERNMRDLQHAHAVISQMLRPQHAAVLRSEYSSGQILSLMENFSFAVGMRLHFLIFAALQHVPFVALPYASKVGGFLEDLKMDTPPLHLVNAGRLIAYIDTSWDKQQRVRANIVRLLPGLQKRAAQTNELVVEFIMSGFRRKSIVPRGK
ncbi:MAG: polysaccharide pyruvyl transferase [Planctomycetes bacterium GWF2_50_10]|nr:MAG: polysaccharide pyruvyl transferase [Planctomycetes bacterium GWF2_50_10]